MFSNFVEPSFLLIDGRIMQLLYYVFSLLFVPGPVILTEASLTKFAPGSTVLQTLPIYLVQNVFIKNMALKGRKHFSPRAQYFTGMCQRTLRVTSLGSLLRKKYQS